MENGIIRPGQFEVLNGCFIGKVSGLPETFEECNVVEIDVALWRTGVLSKHFPNDDSVPEI